MTYRTPSDELVLADPVPNTLATALHGTPGFAWFERFVCSERRLARAKRRFTRHVQKAFVAFLMENSTIARLQYAQSHVRIYTLAWFWCNPNGQRHRGVQCGAKWFRETIVEGWVAEVRAMLTQLGVADKIGFECFVHSNTGQSEILPPMPVRVELKFEVIYEYKYKHCNDAFPNVYANL